MFGAPIPIGVDGSGGGGCTPVNLPNFFTINANFTVGVPFTLDLKSYNSGGTATTWTCSNMPPGVTLNSSTGVLSGTPTSGGIYSGTVTATNACTSPDETIPISFNEL